MASLYTHQEENNRKTWLLMTVFLVFIILLGFVFSYIFDSVLILYFAVIFSLLMNIGSYWYSDKIVLSISGAKEADQNEFKELHRLVENLSITAGLPKPKVYVIQDSVPNAFATGRNKDHSAIAVTTGLLSILEKTELEGVIAHELAHVGNKDILLQTIIVVLVGIVTLLSDFFLRITFHGGSGGDRKDGRIQLILLLVGVVLAILSPIIATIIKLSISRKREFLADATGAMLTRYPEGLASALEKISTYSGKMRNANHATAHLYISNPFGGKEIKVSFLDKLFSTHPPVEERIAALRELR